MTFRLKAFAFHLGASACALLVILGGMYAGWYHWPGWYLTGVLKVLLLVIAVDLVLGPSLTLLIANPRKPRRELARDIAIIAVVQLGALIYGATTLWQGRPLFYTFSADRLETVQASDIKPEDIETARKENGAYVPHWYSRPRWVWAKLPDDPDEATAIVQGSLFGKQDVIEIPRYFRIWDDALPTLRENLSSLSQTKFFSSKEKDTLTTRMRKLRFDPEQKNCLVLWGSGARRLLVVFDPKSARVQTMLRPD